MTHGIMTELLLPGAALARPAGRAVPGGPRDAVYICKHGYLSLKAQDSPAERVPAREQGRGRGPEILRSCSSSSGGCTPSHSHCVPCNPHSSLDSLTLHPRSSRSMSQIPGTADPRHLGFPYTPDNPCTPDNPRGPDPLHSTSPAFRAPLYSGSPETHPLLHRGSPTHQTTLHSRFSALWIPSASDCPAPRNPCTPDNPALQIPTTPEDRKSVV